MATHSSFTHYFWTVHRVGEEWIKVCSPTLCITRLLKLKNWLKIFWSSSHHLFHTGDLHMSLLVPTSGERNSNVSHFNLDCSHTVCSSCCIKHSKLSRATEIVQWCIIFIRHLRKYKLGNGMWQSLQLYIDVFWISVHKIIFMQVNEYIKVYYEAYTVSPVYSTHQWSFAILFAHYYCDLKWALRSHLCVWNENKAVHIKFYIARNSSIFLQGYRIRSFTD